MAQNSSRTETIKQSFLIAFVSISVVLILLTFYLAFHQSSADSRDPAAMQVVVSSQATATPRPSPTPTSDPHAAPTPTLAYWEIQE